MNRFSQDWKDLEARVQERLDLLSRGLRSGNKQNQYEGRTYYNEKRLLRANLSDLTIADILNTLRKAYTASIKN